MYWHLLLQGDVSAVSTCLFVKEEMLFPLAPHLHLLMQDYFIACMHSKPLDLNPEKNEGLHVLIDSQMEASTKE